MATVKVIILGCGPAGLMAAWGVTVASKHMDREVDLEIISRRVKSDLYGCQYLHAPLQYGPELERTWVSYRLRGTADGYRDKVYGPGYWGSVSPEDLAGDHMAWNIRQAYDWLWKRYQSIIIDGEVGPRTIWSLDPNALVINSIPRDALCHQGHAFNSTAIIAAGDAPELGIDIGKHFQCDENSVTCNGEESPSWYRISRVFGHTTVEWPGVLGTVPVTSAATVRKPVNTDCNCHPGLLHVGRYGKWKKGVLSHEAYRDAYVTTIRRILKEDRDAAAEAGA